MRLTLLSTLLVQLAMQQIFAAPMIQFPYSRSANASFKSMGGGSGSFTPLEREIPQYASPRGYSHSEYASTPGWMDEKISRKEKHSKMAKANAARAAKEAKSGFKTGANSIGYGFRESVSRTKDGINEFRNGSKSRGAKQMARAVGSAADGLLLSTVPVVGGIGASIYSGSKAIKHGFSTMKASVLKKKDSRTPLQTVLEKSYEVRHSTPMNRKTNELVEDLMRPNGEVY